MSKWDPGDNRGGPPEPGFYTLRMVRRGPFVPARIVRDLETGLWSAMINGTAVGLPETNPDLHEFVQRIWHYGRRSDQSEYEYLSALKAWAEVHQPEHPLCHPLRPIDVSALPPVVPPGGRN